MVQSQFREVWVESPDGKTMCALISGECGWLMYLREEGDAGFSSRNPDYHGPADAMIEYRLNNGQHDLYPASWAYPLGVIERALQFFSERKAPPPFILWHNDAGDGAVIEYRQV